MSYFETVTATAAYRDRCEDRVAVFPAEERVVIVVADGAGGVGAGDIAAESIVREVRSEYPRIHSADQWVELLRQIDCRIPAGESTAVVLDVRTYGIAGAAVGDSQAWIVTNGTITDLTRNQNRKPLLGSGQAVPVPLMHAPLEGVLLIASDGFFDYARRDRVAPMIAQSDFFSIPRNCIEMVRLPSGELWDDIGVAAARCTPQRRTRKRYDI